MYEEFSIKKIKTRKTQSLDFTEYFLVKLIRQKDIFTTHLFQTLEPALCNPACYVFEL